MKLILRVAWVLGTFGLTWVIGCGEDDSSLTEPAGSEPSAGEDGPALISPLGLELVSQDLESPTYLAAPSGDSALYVAERRGKILLIVNGSVRDEPVLDLRPRIPELGDRELGLFSFAFHPDFESDRYLYVAYSSQDTSLVVERYSIDPQIETADPNSAQKILEVPHPDMGHPKTVHFGGQVAFGPDGLFLISVGDGSLGFDPSDNGQDPLTLAGSLLRIDVDGGDPYTIPPGNPYTGQDSGRDEIWAIGLRNPWRVSIDPATAHLYIADVGELDLEEINVQPYTDGGLNYGWKRMEGSACFEPSTGCDRSGLTLPTFEYAHSHGCAVIGGHVYRGSAIPEVTGKYFYGDFCEGWLESFDFDGGVTDRREWSERPFNNILSISVDGLGELYVLSDGGIWKIVPAVDS